ncbi:hypothetical protein BaRGS_00035725, partial [Batillaria attramentaria]
DFKHTKCTPTGSGVIASVELEEQVSSTSCERGVNYGVTDDKRAIYAEGGCRAKFRIIFASDPETTAAAETSTWTVTKPESTSPSQSVVSTQAGMSTVSTQQTAQSDVSTEVLVTTEPIVSTESESTVKSTITAGDGLATVYTESAVPAESTDATQSELPTLLTESMAVSEQPTVSAETKPSTVLPESTVTAEPTVSEISTITSVSSVSPSAGPKPLQCACVCTQGTQRPDSEQVKAQIQQLQQELTLDHKSLSRSRRKLTSQTDQRVSAIVVGTSGVVIAVLLVVVIPLLDVCHVFCVCRPKLLSKSPRANRQISRQFRESVIVQDSETR